MHAQPTGKIVSCDIDWITATAAIPTGQLRLLSVAVAARREDLEVDGEEKPWAASGFNGWSTAHVQWGTNGKRSMARLGGERAAQHWRGIARAADNISRLDLQCTIEHAEPDIAVVDRVWEAVQNPIARPGRPLGGRIVRGTDGGASCYVGSRSSAIMGRVYDKGIEAGIAPRGTLWRWELELKKPLASDAVKDLLSEDDAMPGVRSRIAHFFRTRLGFSPVADLSYTPRRWPSNPTDSERQLQWLESYVAPTVRRLIRKEGYARTLQALGLGAPPDEELSHPPPTIPKES